MIGMANEPRDVTAAATPTKEWKAATVWGSSVGPTLEDTVSPEGEEGEEGWEG